MRETQLCCAMTLRDPDSRRTWLFGPGADATAHAASWRAWPMSSSPIWRTSRRRIGVREARMLIASLLAAWRDRGKVAAVSINALETEGLADLAAAVCASNGDWRGHH